MTSVLLLQLAGPLQSWGATARFTRRSTENAPTKSGVIGLLAAAQGLPRDADLTKLTGLRFGVRIDQPGVRLRDYQTAHRTPDESMPVSERYYLTDAAFLAGVEGTAELLEELHAALKAPVYPSYLGRRSCPPSGPVERGEVRHNSTLEEALRGEPWLAADWYQRRRKHARTIELSALVEPAQIPAKGADTIRDQPRTFDPRHRQYGLRPIVALPDITVDNPRAADPEPHDPTGALEEV